MNYSVIVTSLDNHKTETPYYYRNIYPNLMDKRLQQSCIGTSTAIPSNRFFTSGKSNVPGNSQVVETCFKQALLMVVLDE
jgi:hypothetical protein